MKSLALSRLAIWLTGSSPPRPTPFFSFRLTFPDIRDKSLCLTGRRFQIHPKTTALTGCRFDADSPAHSFRRPFDNGQSHSGAGIFVARMQALENAKNLFHVLGGNPNPII